MTARKAAPAANTPAEPATETPADGATAAESGTPTETRLDDNVTEPSTVAPGDAPADTTDPTEIATTVTPNPSAQAIAEGTVNGAIKVDKPAAAKSTKTKHRFEEYNATKPDGTVVRVRRNIDTGESALVDAE
ncbi:hypothetical protein [uncultured Microbacterium sp.]|uniref:hypothetical protein n=1 Tax=uncultured Microbacterium sp. TaxID=191216 RepID=UPI0025F1F2EF|nr:hypothetical protein [uncultured Microbacterium sp.]